MPTRWIQAAKAFIKSHWQKLQDYLANERTREISQAENDETAIILFLVVIVFVIAGLNPK